jgi:diaminopimelate decarboxylase/aspartate kinase
MNLLVVILVKQNMGKDANDPTPGQVFVGNNNLGTSVHNAFAKKLYSDARIQLGSGATVHVHKFILASQSTFFADQFSHDTSEIKIDENEELFTKLIDLLYQTQGEIPKEQIVPLHELAQKYKLDGIAESLRVLVPSTVNNVSGPNIWWRQKREQLLKLVAESTPVKPLYVYDEEHLRNRVQTVLDLFKKDMGATVFFAMKANSFQGILKLFESMGLGFECVSMAEVKILQTLFPNLTVDRILFTPNFAPKHEYEAAIKLGIRVTLDNIYPMQQWPDLFRNTHIMVRVDPGEGKGHHDKVKTAGKQSKFGVHISNMKWLAEQCEKYQVTVDGLHAHLGSGILSDYASWGETADFLATLGKELFGKIQYVNCGGGFGVPQKPSDPILDLKKVQEHLQTFAKKHPDVKLIMEPGRYLVAESGVLLANVTQIKSKDDKYFVGVDTGMNSLIRPALYNAYHDIVNLTRVDDVNRQVWNNVDVVGPICESGDILGKERVLPACEEGDVIAIATAGAYGYSMSSNYNQRPGADQILLN